MTLGRTSTTSDGHNVPFPRAVDDEELGAPESSSFPNAAQPQIGISQTSFFVEAIKLADLTGKMLKSLYSESVTKRKATAISHHDEEQNSAGKFDIIMDLERVWTSLYDNLPSVLRWRKGGASVVDPPSTPNTEPMTASKCLERQRNVLHTR